MNNLSHRNSGLPERLSQQVKRRIISFYRRQLYYRFQHLSHVALR